MHSQHHVAGVVHFTNLDMPFRSDIMDFLYIAQVSRGQCKLYMRWYTQSSCSRISQDGTVYKYTLPTAGHMQKIWWQHKSVVVNYINSESSSMTWSHYHYSTLLNVRVQHINQHHAIMQLLSEIHHDNYCTGVIVYNTCNAVQQYQVSSEIPTHNTTPWLFRTLYFIPQHIHSAETIISTMNKMYLVNHNI